MIHNRLKALIAGFMLFLFAGSAYSQEAYWVFFKDKNGVQFDPYTYFDVKAIERRIRNGVPLNDPTDWPLNQNYVQRVSALADSISGETRWFNAVAVLATSEQMSKIQQLPFVKNVQAMNYYAVPCNTSSSSGCSYDMNSQREKQLEIMGASVFRKRGISGKGVRVAIFDGGFPGVDNFLEDNRLIDTWDFTKNKAFVFYSIAHGTMVLSNIGGKTVEGSDTIYYGLASDAEFLLAKTEIRTEPFSEEKNWLMAVEWADKNGADIINSSLGYTYQRYFRSDMDGKTSLVSRAANMAARKGILVVNAAGNDGDSKWHTLGAPADADSVLTVGGVSPGNGYHISFSSFGPTADGRMKPNVCAFGTAIVLNKYGYDEEVDGTSFASPLVSGFAACALQANKNIATMDLFHMIEESGHLYPYFDYAHGYGIPQAKFILSHEKEDVAPTFQVENKDNKLHFKISDNIEFPVGTGYLMYINLANDNGRLIHYFVVEVSQREFDIDINGYYFGNMDDIHRINIYFQNYINAIEF